MPSIADWGGFIIGVLMSEPKTPPLVIVNVPPSISSIERLPSLPLAAKCATTFSIPSIVRLSALRITGTTSPFGVDTAEPHYLPIKRVVFAEELLEDNSRLDSSLIDYKFWSFKGNINYCLVCYNRSLIDKKGSAIYRVPDWKLLSEKTINKNVNDSNVIPKPQKLEEMLCVAHILSKEFHQCRVDLYECNGKVYFGELTFTTACGRIKNYTDDFLLELGNQIDLPIGF